MHAAPHLLKIQPFIFGFHVCWNCSFVLCKLHTHKHIPGYSTLAAIFQMPLGWHFALWTEIWLASILRDHAIPLCQSAKQFIGPQPFFIHWLPYQAMWTLNIIIMLMQGQGPQGLSSTSRTMRGQTSVKRPGLDIQHPWPSITKSPVVGLSFSYVLQPLETWWQWTLLKHLILLGQSIPWESLGLESGPSKNFGCDSTLWSFNPMQWKYDKSTVWKFTLLSTEAITSKGDNLIVDVRCKNQLYFVKLWQFPSYPKEGLPKLSNVWPLKTLTSRGLGLGLDLKRHCLGAKHDWPWPWWCCPRTHPCVNGAHHLLAPGC